MEGTQTRDIPVSRMKKENDDDKETEKKNRSDNIESVEADFNGTTDSSKFDHPKGDIDLFEKMFEQWKKIETSNDKQEKDLLQNVQKLEKQNVENVKRVHELERTLELLQNTVDSVHNDLNLLDKLTKENQDLKLALKVKEESEITLKRDNKEKLEGLEKDLSETRVKHTVEIKKLKEEFDSKLSEQEKEMHTITQRKHSEIGKLKKQHEAELAMQSVEYEKKIGKLHSQKASAAMTQQQQTSSNQEIYRKKLQHMKSEYEAQTSSLKSQIRSLQDQLGTQKNLEQPREMPGMHNRLSVSNVRLFGANRLKRF